MSEEHPGDALDKKKSHRNRNAGKQTDGPFIDIICL